MTNRLFSCSKLAFARALPLISAALLAGCSSSNESTSTTSASGSATSSSGGTTSSSTSTSSSSSSGAGGGGDTVTLTMDTFTVMPGEEVYKCQNFANPFGADTDIQAFESHMTPGSHHLLLFYKDNAMDTPLTNCSGLEFAATPYTTQLPDDTVAYPAGIAAALPAKKGIRLQSHYLNTTGQPVEAHVTMTLHAADPATVKEHAGVLFIVQTNIDVGPNSTTDITYDCHLPADMNVLKVASHMHKHGTKFVSTVAGKPFYNTDTWDEPKPTLYDPAMPLKGGDPLHFACTFVNNSPDTLTFGESAKTNEMCILAASVYPVPAGITTITCQ